jgi:hypothetical protein
MIYIFYLVMTMGVLVGIGMLVAKAPPPNHGEEWKELSRPASTKDIALTSHTMDDGTRCVVAARSTGVAIWCEAPKRKEGP